jgi:hypothetical protein
VLAPAVAAGHDRPVPVRQVQAAKDHVSDLPGLGGLVCVCVCVCVCVWWVSVEDRRGNVCALVCCCPAWLPCAVTWCFVLTPPSFPPCLPALSYYQMQTRSADEPMTTL